MHRLSVRTGKGQGHQQAFGGSKWAVGMQVAGNCRFADTQACYYPGQPHEDFIHCQKSFREHAASVSRIIQGALERRVCGVIPGRPRHPGHHPCQRTNRLGVDRVAFKRHRRRPYLAFAKGLCHLTKYWRLLQAQVKGELVGRLSYTC